MGGLNTEHKKIEGQESYIAVEHLRVTYRRDFGSRSLFKNGKYENEMCSVSSNQSCLQEGRGKRHSQSNLLPTKE